MGERERGNCANLSIESCISRVVTFQHSFILISFAISTFPVLGLVACDFRLRTHNVCLCFCLKVSLHSTRTNEQLALSLALSRQFVFCARLVFPLNLWSTLGEWQMCGGGDGGGVGWLGLLALDWTLLPFCFRGRMSALSLSLSLSSHLDRSLALHWFRMSTVTARVEPSDDNDKSRVQNATTTWCYLWRQLLL